MFKISTREPGPVLGNLDLNRTLVGNLYSRTWTRTWEPGPVLVYVLSRNRFCTHGPISVTHTVHSIFISCKKYMLKSESGHLKGAF